MAPRNVAEGVESSPSQVEVKNTKKYYLPVETGGENHTKLHPVIVLLLPAEPSKTGQKVAEWNPECVCLVWGGWVGGTTADQHQQPRGGRGGRKERGRTGEGDVSDGGTMRVATGGWGLPTEWQHPVPGTATEACQSWSIGGTGGGDE